MKMSIKEERLAIFGIIVGCIAIAWIIKNQWGVNAGSHVAVVNTNTNGVKEIGWRPIIKGVEEETVSGVTYITVSINGDTNDVASYRSCFINLHSGGCLPDDKIFWRLNPKARAQEAYIVSKDMNMTSRPMFFVMRNAKITRYDR